MKIVFIGCVKFSYVMLENLLGMNSSIEVVGVVSREKSEFNADFQSLEPLAQLAGIPCYLAKGNDQEAMASWIKILNPDVIYCFGWSFLLHPEILNISEMGVVGYHPTALPKNRGRHPIIWSLALGLSDTASTFFFMDEGADSGDILSQDNIEIDGDDDAGSLYGKLLETAKSQLAKFTNDLASGEYQRIPQIHSQANYWRKRKKADGLIDWRMPAQGVNNLVRALTRPYVGAHCLYGDAEKKIWKVEVASDRGAVNVEPGKVLSVEGRKVRIKCGVGAVDLIEHSILPLPQVGDYL